jgi:hypothetical protein
MVVLIVVLVVVLVSVIILVTVETVEPEVLVRLSVLKNFDRSPVSLLSESKINM